MNELVYSTGQVIVLGRDLPKLEFDAIVEEMFLTSKFRAEVALLVTNKSSDDPKQGYLGARKIARSADDVKSISSNLLDKYPQGAELKNFEWGERMEFAPEWHYVKYVDK